MTRVAKFGVALAAGLIVASTGFLVPTGTAEAGGCKYRCAKPVKPRCYSPCYRPKPKPKPPVTACYKCYKKVVTPPTYRKVPKEVLVQKERTETRWTPPEYGTVTETKVIRQEQTRYTYTPAKYSYESEKVKVSDGKTVWKKKGGLWCEVTIEPQYKTVHKKILISEATKTPHFIPAITTQYTRKVVVREGYKTSHTIPAVYKTVHVSELDTPASESWVQVSSGCKRGFCGGYASATPPPGLGGYGWR
jgi:hypothetical protein